MVVVFVISVLLIKLRYKGVYQKKRREFLSMTYFFPLTKYNL